jgi:hypothetical protein
VVGERPEVGPAARSRQPEHALDESRRPTHAMATPLSIGIEWPAHNTGDNDSCTSSILKDEEPSRS